MPTAKLTQQNHCVLHQFCFALYSCVFTDAKPMCLQQKVYSSLQMWRKIKGSNTEIQAPFPFGTCFYYYFFFSVALNQNFHLLSLCSVQVNLNSRVCDAVISTKKGRDESLLHVGSEHRTQQQKQGLPQTTSRHFTEMTAETDSFLPFFLSNRKLGNPWILSDYSRI